jgi:hypothetical protein
MLNKFFTAVGSFLRGYYLVFFSKNRTYINSPETFEQAMIGVTAIMNTLPEKARERLLRLKTPEDFATALHHGLGQSLRNNWKLWQVGSPLVKHFNDRFGVSHADDISGIVLMCYHQQFNNQPITPEEFAKGYKAYWKTQMELLEGEESQ